MRVRQVRDRCIEACLEDEIPCGRQAARKEKGRSEDGLSIHRESEYT